MNKFRIFFALALAGCVMLSCKSKVDLDNIDKHAEVQVGMAIPVATMSATMGDFFGDGKLVEQIQVGTGAKIDGGNGVDKGVLFFRFLKTNDKNYHEIDLKNYLQNANQTFKINDYYPSLTTIPANAEMTLEFPLVMHLTGINNELTNERLDKMTISAANFISKISLQNLSVSKDDIQKVEIVLHGSNRNASIPVASRTQGYFDFGSSADKIINVEGFKTQGFNKEIPIEIDDFDIYLMKENRTFTRQSDWNANALKELAFDFKFYLKPKSNITINSNSAISYNFIIDFLKYSALYGYFEPSNLMIDNETDTIANEWAEWSSLKNMQLALAKPRIDLDVTCAIAAPLTVNVREIYVSTENGETRYATFDESGQQRTRLYPFYNDLQITDPLNATVTNSFYLNEELANGRLDYLFMIRPDYVHWDYYLTIRTGGENLQHRLTENTEIHTDITATVPFQFKEGMLVNYSDTTDISWAGMSLDSLAEKTGGVIDSIGASNVKMRLKADNTIPLDISLQFAFLDENDQPIDLSGLSITEDGKSVSDSIYIKAANNVETGGNVSIVNGQQVATSTIIWMNLSAEQFNKITQAKKFVYTATLNTSSASFRDNKWVNVRNISGLKIQLGVAADVDAFLNLDMNGNNENN